MKIYFLKLNEQIQTRSRKYESSIQLLSKFNGEYEGLINYLNQIQSSLNSIENAYVKEADNFDKLKESEEKAKLIEKDLLSRQADIRFMTISYQNFSNLTDSFSRDLQNYYAKFKDSRRIKHLSTDFQTDLTHLKD